MSLKSTIGLAWARRRAAAIRRQLPLAPEIQARTFRSLLRRAAGTVFGKAHGFASIRSYAEFQQQVPVRDYEQMRPWLDRVYRNEPDITWPGRPLYLAKTSGTTSGTKYIPITADSIRKQIGGARDTLMMYMAETGRASFLDGRMMFLSGSPEIERNAHGVRTGRLSGIVNHFVPGYLTANRVPSWDANIIEDWEEKVRTIVQEIKGQDLRLISGIPPWVQMLFEELQQQTGKRPLEVWPNLQLFVQGGVDFSPYRPIFRQYFEGKVDIAELYPASEGFFAIQTDQQDPALALMPDYGVFYEFIPLDQYGRPDARRLTLAEVEAGQQYALIISTNSGLWAYDIGDTVKFTSVNPWKIRVSGRVKHFISAFGEHVIGEEVNDAMGEAVQAAGCEVQEFTVAPLIAEEKGASAHEWLIEFSRAPADLEAFAEALDQALRRRNTYYNDLREGNILRRAVVRSLQLNASREYMKSVGKLGGQNKFPRLSNDRRIADALAGYVAG
ncbi:MAG: GH3 auxin-responsive promoter family protein [Bacteroidia bacterium]|nr:GH3 auxin-responsive promoter family protein [Bacteroidia bacterium]